jgi:hypothetical protein
MTARQLELHKLVKVFWQHFRLDRILVDHIVSSWGQRNQSTRFWLVVSIRVSLGPDVRF